MTNYTIEKVIENANGKEVSEEVYNEMFQINT